MRDVNETLEKIIKKGKIVKFINKIYYYKINMKFKNLVPLVMSGVVAVNSALGGLLEIKHNSSNPFVERKESVKIVDNSYNSEYLWGPGFQKLIAFNQNGEDKFGYVGINSDKFEKHNVYLVQENVTPGTERNIRLRFVNSDMNDYATRNMVIQQDAGDVSADPKVYDALELTNWGTAYGYVDLPSITGGDTDNQKWWATSTNYADINFDGKVDYKDFNKLAGYFGTSGHDASNNYADFADINRDGSVDDSDLVAMANEWGWDGTQ